jgi:lipoate---protein ligase
MHGEYKIPGGKLVVIELDIVNDTLRNVRLSGDFFLEPDETLGAMTAAIEGLPVTADQARIGAAVARAAAGAELLGITPMGVAIAVRRAVESNP